MIHRFLIATFLAACGLSLALPAHALLPEIYAGVGARAVSADDTAYAATVEAGVDDILADLGVGLRLDLPDMDPVLTAELRYSLFSMPFVRVLAGIGAGAEKTTQDWNGTYSAFLGARLSLGMPYLGLSLGATRVGDWQPYGTLTVGAVF